jgi:hypothetical protein
MDDIAPILLILFNKILQTGIFPQCWLPLFTNVVLKVFLVIIRVFQLQTPCIKYLQVLLINECMTLYWPKDMAKLMSRKLVARRYPSVFFHVFFMSVLLLVLNVLWCLPCLLVRLPLTVGIPPEFSHFFTHSWFFRISDHQIDLGFCHYNSP